MAKIKSIVETTLPPPEPSIPLGPLTVNELVNFLSSRGAERAQVIRVTGSGSLNTSIIPKDQGNMILVIEINPNAGVIV